MYTYCWSRVIELVSIYIFLYRVTELVMYLYIPLVQGDGASYVYIPFVYPDGVRYIAGLG